MKRNGYMGLLLGLLTGCGPACVDQVPGASVMITAPSGKVISNWTLLDQAGSSGTNVLNAQNARLVWLPLNPNATQTRYSVRIDGQTDTLTMRYNLGLGSVSQRCGYSFTMSRPAQGEPVSRRLGQVDSVFYSGEQGFGSGWLVQSYQLRIRLSL